MSSKQKMVLGWALIVIFVIAQVLRLTLDSSALVEGFTWVNITWIVGSLIVVAAGIMLAAGSRDGRSQSESVKK